MKSVRTSLLAAILAASMGGCSSGSADLCARLQSEDPAVRIEAIHQAGDRKDASAVPLLVDRLTDSERDVRFYAILALERITGQTMGYRHWGSPESRQEAVERWRGWLKDGRSAGGAASAPSASRVSSAPAKEGQK